MCWHHFSIFLNHPPPRKLKSCLFPAAFQNLKAFHTVQAAIEHPAVKRNVRPFSVVRRYHRAGSIFIDLNVFRQKRWSLLCCYYTAADYEDSLCKYCAENGMHLKILSAENKQPGVLHCRVRLWEVKQFLKAAAKLKNAASKQPTSYIAVREKISVPTSLAPAKSL